MAELVALRPILYAQREYDAGDLLPSDAPLAEAWMECGSALWRASPPQQLPTATPAAAEPGLPGTATGGGVTGNDLVGKISPTPERRRSRGKRKL